MMKWNYRLVKTIIEEEGLDRPYTNYEIHEVYYDDDGNPDGMTTNPVSAHCIEDARFTDEECKEEIIDWLWKTYGKQLLRHSIKGLPEWYKEKLLTDL